MNKSHPSVELTVAVGAQAHHFRLASRAHRLDVFRGQISLMREHTEAAFAQQQRLAGDGLVKQGLRSDAIERVPRPARL